MKVFDLNSYDAVGELLCVLENKYDFKGEDGNQISGTSYSLVIRECGRNYNNVIGDHVITLKLSAKTRFQDLYVDHDFFTALFANGVLPTVGVNYYYDSRYKRYVCSFAELLSVTGAVADDITGHHVNPDVFTDPADR